MYTEEEARTKWCPNTRYHGNHEQGGGSNKPIPDYQPQSPQCIASDCMAWRRDGPRVIIKHKPTGGTRSVRLKEAKMVCGPEDDFEVVEHAPQKGYCGAFGKPEAD